MQTMQMPVSFQNFASLSLSAELDDQQAHRAAYNRELQLRHPQIYNLLAFQFGGRNAVTDG